jgi:hypothetical protein
VAVAVIVEQAQQGLLAGFRQGWYGCLGRRADGLFELTDALLCTPGSVGSLPQLSLEPGFRRGWGSLYGALAEGEVAAEAVRDLLVAYRPVGWPLVFAVDQTTWPRCDAECSPARGLYHHPSRPSAGQPIVAGWAYQWVCQLGWEHDSWTAPVDARRILPTADPVQATVGQARALVQRLGATRRPRPSRRSRCWCSTPATTRSRSPVGWPRPGWVWPCWCASDPTACSTPTRPRGRPGQGPAPQARPAGRLAGAGELASTSTASSPSATPATGRSRWRRGRGCTPNSGPAGGSRRPRSHRSCAAPLSGSRSADCPSPPAGSRSCGCGGQAREHRIWTWSGGRTCAASTSSTRCGFASRRWAGSPPGCAILSRPTGGPGCWWPRPPNSAWPGHWSPTTACRGNGGLIRIGSPPPVSDGGFAGFTRPTGGRQGAETLPARPGAAQRLASRPSSPPSCHQEERRTGHPKPTSRLKRKLSEAGFRGGCRGGPHGCPPTSTRRDSGGPAGFRTRPELHQQHSGALCGRRPPAYGSGGWGSNPPRRAIRFHRCHGEARAPGGVRDGSGGGRSHSDA